MKRLLGLASVIAAIALMTAGGASAAPRGAGCPPGFELVDQSILGDFTGKIIDLHGDELICIRRLQPGFDVFFDNVVP
jgi:hypothetical protein